MKLLELKRNWLDGEPRLKRQGNHIQLKAAHRLPSSKHEQIIGLWMIGLFMAAATLVSNYAPDIVPDPEANFLLENAAMIVMALSNAFDALLDVARPDGPEVPLDKLGGWIAASVWIAGVFAVRISGLFDLYTWLTNREHVTIDVNDERFRVRHGTFRLPKLTATDGIEGVLILRNHRTGHDVMLQHEGGLIRLASVCGDLTRPTLIKQRVERAIAEVRRPVRSETDRRGLAPVETG